MFDAIEGQFVAGQLDEHVMWTADDQEDSEVLVQPILDSLASARIEAVCEIGFQFNATTRLCGTCAPNSSYTVLYVTPMDRATVPHAQSTIALYTQLDVVYDRQLAIVVDC